MNKPELDGKRILVVEDEYLLSMDICAEIEACGGKVVGPAASLDAARTLLQEIPDLDGSILDIRLGTDYVYPLADNLIDAGVPVAFASFENRSATPDEYASVPLVTKPINMAHVAEELFPAGRSRVVPETSLPLHCLADSQS